MMKNRLYTAVTLIAWPLLGYPFFFVLSITYDTLLGDRLLLFTLKHGSRSELLWTTLSDWAHALVISYLLAAIVAGLMYVWSRWFSRHLRSALVLLSAVACALTAFYDTGQVTPLVWIATLTGILWAASLNIVTTWLIRLNI